MESPTFKMMMAMCEGKWLLSVAWMDACIAANTLLPVDEYEINGTVDFPNHGPARAREQRLKGGSHLLQGVHICVHGECSVVSPAQVSRMIESLGGAMITRESLQGKRLDKSKKNAHRSRAKMVVLACDENCSPELLQQVHF